MSRTDSGKVRKLKRDELVALHALRKSTTCSTLRQALTSYYRDELDDPEVHEAASKNPSLSLVERDAIVFLRHVSRDPFLKSALLAYMARGTVDGEAFEPSALFENEAQPDRRAFAKKRRAKIAAQQDYKGRVDQSSIELQSIYDDFCLVTDAKRLEVANQLIKMEGTVDAESEGYDSIENQRDLSIKFYWGHNHRFSESLFVTGKMGNRHVKLVAQFMTAFDLELSYFRDKSIIDVGCWTGGTSLMLKALGAGKVLAIEEVKKYASACATLLADVYNISDFECKSASLFSLKTKTKYDLVYCPGVVYHLSDPVVGLRRLFNACRDGGEILVETAGFDSDQSVCRFDGSRVHSIGAAEDLSRSGWGWFIPSPKCLERWLSEAGFRDVRSFHDYESNRILGHARREERKEILRSGLSVPEIE